MDKREDEVSGLEQLPTLTTLLHQQPSWPTRHPISSSRAQGYQLIGFLARVAAWKIDFDGVGYLALDKVEINANTDEPSSLYSLVLNHN